MIIGITGLARAGKDTVAEYLSKRYGFKVLVFSDILREEAQKKGIEPTKDNLSILGDELRKEGGMGVLAKKILEKMKKGENYVLVGFRSPEEVDIIRNEYLGQFVLLRIDADQQKRWERRKKDDPQTKEAFFARDKRDIENKGLGKVLNMADYVLENNGTLKELYEKVDKFLQDIGWLE